MDVFLSWSGPQSKAIADVYYQWLPSVLQAVKPFYSPEDVEKGSFWFGEITEGLLSAGAGLLFVTPGNKERPWLLFEAGALSIKFGKPRVVPLLFDLEPAELSGPLVSLNAATFAQEETRKVVATLNNALGEAKLESQVVNKVFAKWWPDLKTDVENAIKAHPEEAVEPTRTQDDVLEEILLISRQLHRRLARLEDWQEESLKLIPFSDRSSAAERLSTFLSFSPEVREVLSYNPSMNPAKMRPEHAHLSAHTERDQSTNGAKVSEKKERKAKPVIGP